MNDMLQNLIEIENLIFNYDEKTFHSTLKSISCHRLAYSPQGIKIIASTFVNAAKYRCGMHESLAKLAYRLSISKIPLTFWATFPSTLLSEFIQCHTSIALFQYFQAIESFLYQCYKTSLFLFQDIQTLITTLRSRSSFLTDADMCITLWFVPELYEVDPEATINFLNVLSLKGRTGDFKEMTDPIFQNIQKLMDNNWSLYKKYRAQGFEDDPIWDALIHDDQISLQNLSSDPQFDFEKKITPSLFSPHWLVKYKPTLIEFAALVGATNCFRFLYLNQVLNQYSSPFLFQSEFSNQAFSFFSNNNSQYSLNNQINIISNNPTLVHYAIAGGNIEILRTLERNLCDFSDSLSFAARFHRTNIFEYLINIFQISPKTIDQTNSLGNTPLFEAVCSNCPEIVCSCINHGGNSNILLFQERPIHAAVDLNCLGSLLALFTNKKLDINARNGANETALHLAVKHNYSYFIPYLLKIQNLQINVKDKEGNTPLHIAAINGNTEICKMIVKDHRTNTSILDNLRNTPSMVALINGHSEAAKILRTVHVDVRPQTTMTPSRNPKINERKSNIIFQNSNCIRKGKTVPNFVTPPSRAHTAFGGRKGNNSTFNLCFL